MLKRKLFEKYQDGYYRFWRFEVMWCVPIMWTDWAGDDTKWHRGFFDVWPPCAYGCHIVDIGPFNVTLIRRHCYTKDEADIESFPEDT